MLNVVIIGGGAAGMMAAIHAGGSVRVAMVVGKGPQSTPEENFQNLLQRSKKFDNIQIK